MDKIIFYGLFGSFLWNKFNEIFSKKELKFFNTGFYFGILFGAYRTIFI
jgi:hypothetical protein